MATHGQRSLASQEVPDDAFASQEPHLYLELPLPGHQNSAYLSVPEAHMWRRKWQPTPVFLPGEAHGQRSLVDYSPWDHKELDTAEQLSMKNTSELLRVPRTFICDKERELRH